MASGGFWWWWCVPIWGGFAVGMVVGLLWVFWIWVGKIGLLAWAALAIAQGIQTPCLAKKNIYYIKFLFLFCFDLLK